MGEHAEGQLAAELEQRGAVVRTLGIKLSLVVDRLKRNERRHPELFTGPVDPFFVKAWRDYEERYDSVVPSLFMAEFLVEFGLSLEPKADAQWDKADREADEQSRAIEEAIDFAEFNAEQTYRWWEESQQDWIERVRYGISAWLSLKESAGVDLRGVFRRRALVPFVLLPRQVTAKHGTTEKLSMLKNLQQAQQAFIHGASYAALALMRSIMETVLREHYGAEGKDLKERIRNARYRLPRDANDAMLHRLRRLANAVLHLDLEKNEGLANMDEMQLEKEIVALLVVLRALIEGVN